MDKAERLNEWLGLPQVVRDKWSARQPAILAASICLLLFFWSLDITHQDLALVLGVIVVAAIFSLILSGGN
jgi:hypothetical protein